MVPLTEANMALVRRICEPDIAEGLERQSGMCFYPDALNALLDAARAEAAEKWVNVAAALGSHETRAQAASGWVSPPVEWRQ